jgi:ribosomal protein S18 acetylase RimI-like enzyme
MKIRPAKDSESKQLEELVIDAFEPITKFKQIDEQFGTLGGLDWRQRWERRFHKIFSTETVLVGEVSGEIVAFASGTVDRVTQLGFIDLLAVAQSRQGKGYGRAMLRGMLDYMKSQGMEHAHLDCLVDNEVGNHLYAAEGFEEYGRTIHWMVRIP